MSRHRLQFALLAAAVLAVPHPLAHPAAVTLRFDLLAKDTIEARLKKFAGKNQQREETLKQMFIEAGCGEHITEQKVKGSKLFNLVCTLPGSSDKAIIIGAHYDYVAEGDGVVDNWSGASLLPSLYGAIKGMPRKHTYVFINFTDEEKGQVGSRFYVHEMTNEQVANTVAMVNLDTLGLGPAEVWYSHSDRALTLDLFHVARVLDMSVNPVDVDQIGSTDSESFDQRKMARVTIHSLTQETWNAGILHSPKDKLSLIKMSDYYDTYHLVAAYLAYLDDAIAVPQPAKAAM
jgi:hypothetical protein